jgi:hypothetical protein
MRASLAVFAALFFGVVLPAPGQSTTAPVGKEAAATDGQVWGALVYAVTDKSKLTGSKEIAPGLVPDLYKRLGKAFSFTEFEILGQHTQDVFREYESWVVPSPELFLKVDSKGPAEGGGINLHLQFWRQQQVLVKTDTILRANSPLFIQGPKWRDGQLIFVLALKRE